MIATLRELGYQAKLAVSKSAREQHEALQEELVIKRILQKAIDYDPKNGAVMGGTVVGDKIITDKAFVEEDEAGLMFEPTKSSLSVVEEATEGDIARLEEYILRQQILLQEEKEAGEAYISSLTGEDNGTDPYNELKWIENNR